MKKTVCIVTATRAEWGLLRSVAEQIKAKEKLELIIAATGTHFCAAYGNTYKEIIADGFDIDERVDTLLYPESPAAVSKTMGLIMIGFADMFARRRIDLLIVLGDRYETLAVCMAAMSARIPIAHLHGGETTVGAMDEGIRHAITKLASLHFTSCESHRKRVIQLGEHPERVFNTGAPGIDNIWGMKMLSRQQLSVTLGFDLVSHPYAVVTFHPVTLEENTFEEQCRALFEALSAFPEMRFIITKSNADEGGSQINKLIDTFAAEKNNVLAVPSLGSLKYLSTLKYASLIIGNSSSGIIEAPYFGIPTVNIGDRQKGRLQTRSIINCPASTNFIIEAMRQALSPDFRQELKNFESVYGDGNAARRIADIVVDQLCNDKIELKKEFFNLEFTY